MVAGGAIVATAHNAALSSSAWGSSDIDVFMVGLDIDLARVRVVQFIGELERGLRRYGLEKYTLIRTRNTVTLDFPTGPIIDPKYTGGVLPLRTVQIILRVYDDIEELLAGFDVDCCCFAFDGKRLWGSLRGMEALSLGVNLVDLSKATLALVYRMLKYAKRGFAPLDGWMVKSKLSYKRVGKKVPGGWEFKSGLLKRLKGTIDDAHPGLETLALADLYFRGSEQVLVPQRHVAWEGESDDDDDALVIDDYPEASDGASGASDAVYHTTAGAMRQLNIPLDVDTVAKSIIGPGMLVFRTGRDERTSMTEAEWIKYAFKDPKM